MACRSWSAQSVQAIIALVMSLHDVASGIQCHVSSGPLVNWMSEGSGYTELCGERHISCHEHYHRVDGSKTIDYLAGCGSYVMDVTTQLLGRNALVEQGTKECFTDGCNKELLSQLQASHRVCWSAERSLFTFAAFSVVCAQDVTHCYLDRMTGAKEPAYYAGCGDCPSYTLYCATCDTSYCNATDTRRVIYVEQQQDAEDPQVLQEVADNAVSTVSRLGRAALLTLASGALCLLWGSHAS